MDAIVNKPFTGTFRVPHETGDSVTCYISTHDDSAIGDPLSLPRVGGGYFFGHTFTNAGFFKIKVVDSDGSPYYSSVRVNKEFATVEGLADVKETYETNHVIVKESAVYFKQLLTTDFISGGPVDFSFVFTPNSEATTDEENMLSGPWEQGINKNFDSGSFDSSANFGDIVTYHNGVFSIIATGGVSTMLAGQSQNTDSDTQWLISDLRHNSIQSDTITSIDSDYREDFSIRNFTVISDAEDHLYLLTGDVYRTVSSYGSINGNDVIIGTITGTVPSAHAHIDFTISKEGTTDTATGDIEIFHGEDKAVVQRQLHRQIINAVNSNGDFNDGLVWVYDAANERINTRQPYLTRFTIGISLNNTDGTGGLGAQTTELVVTTALLSSGLAEDERTAVLSAISVDDLYDIKTDIIGPTSPLAREESLDSISSHVRDPFK